MLKYIRFALIFLIYSMGGAIASPFGNIPSFIPGDKLIYKFDGSNCPVGDISPDFKIIFKSYDCVDYKGKRWIRPLEHETFLYKPLKFPKNFSIEFTYLAFEEGRPFVRFSLYSKNTESDILNKKLYIYDVGVLMAVESYNDEVRFAVSSKPLNAGNLLGNFGFSRKVEKGIPHKVQISVQNGRVKLYIDGERKLIKPIEFNNEIGGFGLFFRFVYSTSKSIAESPALITDIKIAEYTGKKTVSKTTPTVIPEPVNPKPKPITPEIKKHVETTKVRPSSPKNLRCISSTGTGEASITTDYASAKMEAFARAKWDALEKALGTQVNVKSVVENFKLLDEVITKDVKGFIRNVKIINEENYGDYVRITIKGCVYPQQAEKALSLLTKNTAFNVLLIVQDRNNIEIDEMNPVNTELINILNQQGFEIYDFAGQPDIDPYKIENIIAQRRFISLRSLLLRSLAGATIIGKIRFIYQTRGGQNIGYGISSPFNVVRAQAQYYLLIKNKGRIRILASGTVSAKGMAPNSEDAKNKAMLALAPKLADDILQKIERYMASKRKVVKLYVYGIKSVSDNFAVKKDIQKLPWVKSIKDVGIGKFTVEYLENPIYLANALESILGYKVIDFSPTRIKIKKGG